MNMLYNAETTFICGPGEGLKRILNEFRRAGIHINSWFVVDGRSELASTGGGPYTFRAGALTAPSGIPQLYGLMQELRDIRNCYGLSVVGNITWYDRANASPVQSKLQAVMEFGETGDLKFNMFERF